jgi:hypothetical protein
MAVRRWPLAAGLWSAVDRSTLVAVIWPPTAVDLLASGVWILAGR